MDLLIWGFGGYVCVRPRTKRGRILVRGMARLSLRSHLPLDLVHRIDDGLAHQIVQMLEVPASQGIRQSVLHLLSGTAGMLIVIHMINPLYAAKTAINGRQKNLSTYYCTSGLSSQYFLWR